MATPVYERFAARGRMLPFPGSQYRQLDRPAAGGALFPTDGDGGRTFARWTSQGGGPRHVEIVPVVGSKRDAAAHAGLGPATRLG